jgi:membrane-bound lytic murein transglycosylase C
MMVKKLLISVSFLSITTLCASNDFINYNKEFLEYKQSQENAFKSYLKQQNDAYNEYKKELEKYWKNPELTTKRKLVSYSQDKKSKTSIDFQNDKLRIEVIANSKQEAKQKMQVALAKAVTIDTKTLIKNDPLEKKLSKIPTPRDVQNSKVDANPILTNVVFKKPPTKKSVYVYVQKNVKEKKIQEKKSIVKNKNLYTLNVDLPKNTAYRRSTLYYDDVHNNAIKQQIPLELIFAVIHSESSYNPMARSHIPAYGLMQIVPKTAGIDSYFYLYKRKKIVSSHYLYNSKNNIKMGSAYLHILYYSYLRGIKDPTSRLYCTIAAYNTGAGNVAWAFVHKRDTKKAAKVINTMTPKEVYNHLLNHLKYDEPKHYLVKVHKRMLTYKKIYGRRS